MTFKNTISKKLNVVKTAPRLGSVQLTLLALLAISISAIPSSGFCDLNFAPFFSDSGDSTLLPSRSHLIGPLLGEDIDGATSYGAVRPVIVTCKDSTTDTGWICSFYPLFSMIDYPNGYRWNIFELCVGSKNVSATGHPITSFEIWPVCWHYDNGVPEESYDGILPLAGTLQNRLFFKRIDWFAFPAFARFQQQDHSDVYILWPIFRSRSGEKATGYAAWPLFGHFEKEGVYDNTYFFWPLIYDNYRTLPADKGGGTSRNFGMLPLVAGEDAPGLKSRTYVWPFFGYTTKSAPRETYHETRFLYPFVVFGKGDNVDVERILPLFTHEFSQQHHKTWVLWPMLRVDDTRMDFMEIHKDTMFYFLYKNEVQTSPGRDFKARKTQLWPLFGYIDNGAGKKQFQILNPFEPFFSGNEMIRQSWTPFFALYRYEKSGDEMRRSFLWNFVLYNRNGGNKELSVSIFYSKKTTPESSGWSIAKGLLSHENKGEIISWKAFWGLLGSKEDEK